jgi:2,4-dienoyl-CoA reductase (NADPH2)
VGKKVVVAGGGQVGVETADFIAEKSLAECVIIIEMLPMLAFDMPTMTRTYMLKVLLPKWGVKTIANMQIQEITDDGIVALDKEWKRHKFECDTVVNALGYVSNTALSEALNGEVQELYEIGDCIRPRNILHAVGEAAYIARQI